VVLGEAGGTKLTSYPTKWRKPWEGHRTGEKKFSGRGDTEAILI